MTRPIAPLALLLAAWLLVAPAAANAAEPFKGGVFDPPHAAPEFELRGTNGSPLTLDAYRGKVVILEFGFTTCEKVCPVTVANLVQVYKELGAAASDVQLVFVTVDPERDTLERLRTWLGAFHESFVGATGTPEQLAAMRQAYGIIATKEQAANPQNGYQVHHSSSFYLVDRKGLLRVLEPFGKPPADIAHDIRLLLAEQ